MEGLDLVTETLEWYHWWAATSLAPKAERRGSNPSLLNALNHVLRMQAASTSGRRYFITLGRLIVSRSLQSKALQA